MDETAREGVVERYYDHVDDGDVDALVALFADDVVYDRPGHDAIEGRDALEQFYREDRPLTDGSHELSTVVVEDETVVVTGKFRGRQDGERVTLGFADVYEFDGDVIARRKTYTDRGVV
jgi:ketosteroid isomerase-like protein